MVGKGRCGHVLKVDCEYRSSSQFRIRSLFSGVGSKGNVLGLGGTDSRCGHLQPTPSSELLVQPELTDLMCLVSCDDAGAVVGPGRLSVQSACGL